MRKMTLEEIQSVNLEMMSEIHMFCEEHKIHYSLAYGSLIGAIRHKGFIPWDDDIDIMMPRPDYERFSRQFVSKKGFRLAPAYDKDTYVNYTRLYDNRTLVICRAKAAKFDIGVWIDIYPIDGVSPNREMCNEQFQRIRRYTGLVMKWRIYLYEITKKGIINKLKSSIRLFQIWIGNRGDFSYWHKRINEICQEVPFGSTNNCSSLLCVSANKNDKQEIFETADFQDFILIPFENHKFYIASGYDRILKTIFGNYMTIPPKEQQVSHLINKWGFYWK